MTSIGASTGTHRVKMGASKTPPTRSPNTLSPAMSRNSSSSSLYSMGGTRKMSKRPSSNQLSEIRGFAAQLEAISLSSEAQLAGLKLMEASEAEAVMKDLLNNALGVEKFNPNPHTASDTKSRGGAAADLARGVKTLGVLSLRRMGIFAAVKGNLQHPNPPPNALEGSLLVVRALCESVGASVEPFVMPLLNLVLTWSSHASGSIRDAAEDTCRAMMALVNTYAICMVIPVLFTAFNHPEWRVKENALQRLSQLASLSPLDISVLLPKILPKITPMVWDTKTQVSKCASKTILECCKTNLNPDVKPAIPEVVKAICKPSETVRAIEKLMHTTFVASVDASTLSIICPVLSRGLKEKLTNNKRMSSIVIENMSKLVDSPTAVAPFGSLLVPELKKVCENVQFEEIRDVAIAALKTLTKALGHSSIEEATEKYAAEMIEESKRLEAEQKAIEDERAAMEAKIKKEQEDELEERRKFKEAMEAARRLEKLKEDEDKKKQEKDQKAKDKAKKSTKAGGKCQGCGLKKCKKSCLFYTPGK